MECGKSIRPTAPAKWLWGSAAEATAATAPDLEAADGFLGCKGGKGRFRVPVDDDKRGALGSNVEDPADGFFAVARLAAGIELTFFSVPSSFPVADLTFEFFIHA
mmetsp:Transcript_50545/g.145738  ORF Transcript_50545/g.145738 Transcript_50545/m.145738 type:complete len:105 (-) Transcript_50545:289-603(-)